MLAAGGEHFIALAKASERYIFFFDKQSRSALLKTFGRFAADPELSFTWHDAAILTKKLRGMNDEPVPRIDPAD